MNLTHARALLLVLLAACGAAGAPPGASPPDPGAPATSAGPAGSARALVLDASRADGAPLAKMTPALDFARKRYGRRLAVTIGIDAYSGPVPRLESAVSDARHMAQLFRDQGFDTVEVLENENASRPKILDLLERKLPLMTAAKDLVVVFFAGHGFTVKDEGFLLPYGAGPPFDQSGLSMQTLKETALRFKAVHTLFVVDACFSGAMFRKGAAPATTNDLAYWESAAAQRAVHIIAGGAANEKTHEVNGWGVFTRVAFDALNGAADENHDGVVTSEELARYVEERVPREAGGAQHPHAGTVDGTAPVLLWDARKVPAGAAATRFASLPLIPGMEKELTAIHDLMDKQEWQEADKRIRTLAVSSANVELNLLLAEVYLNGDALGRSALIESELKRVEEGSPTAAQQKRLVDLRARLEHAKRGAL